MFPTPQPIRLDRDAEYGDAWKWQNALMGGLQEHLDIVIAAGYFHPWYMILTKLIRLLHYPEQLDSWRDIIGYAQLVIDDLDRQKGSSA